MVPLQSLSRREWLRLGGVGLTGLTLPKLLAASETPSSARPKAKSCLLIFMEGGPSHIDLWDMKPDAPAEVRGEFEPIPTRIPGVPVCEHLPMFSQQIHRLALVRSVTHNITDHNAGTYYALTGRHPGTGGQQIKEDGPTNFPALGAVLAKLRPTGRPLPDFVHVAEVMSNLGVDIAGQSAGFLGAAYDPLVTGDPSLPRFEVPGMNLKRGVTAERVRDRQSLLESLNGGLEKVADSPALDRMDTFHRKAVELVTSPEARKAFDLSEEPRKVRERYGLDPGTDRSIEARKFGGLPHLGQSMLLARRLIESGVRLVTLVTGRRIDQAWDTHRQHFKLLKRSLCPMFDRSLSALLQDMYDRGLLDETLVVIMGEFGRTPKIGAIVSDAGADKNGRDHWPFCYTVMFGGAGVPGGALIGASDKIGAYPSEEPFKPEDVTATIYRAMGVPMDQEVHDTEGRPLVLMNGRPITKLWG